MLSDRFRAAVEEGNVEHVPDLFHEDAVFRSPVLFKPYEGRDQVLKVLRDIEKRDSHRLKISYLVLVGMATGLKTVRENTLFDEAEAVFELDGGCPLAR